jgi:ArsR family metal-binding transcriptional regulator
MEAKEMIEKIKSIRKEIEKMREATLSPAIDSSLRVMDIYAFLIQGHLGVVEDQICPED